MSIRKSTKKIQKRPKTKNPQNDFKNKALVLLRPHITNPRQPHSLPKSVEPRTNNQRRHGVGLVRPAPPIPKLPKPVFLWTESKKIEVLVLVAGKTNKSVLSLDFTQEGHIRELVGRYPLHLALRLQADPPIPRELDDQEL